MSYVDEVIEKVVAKNPAEPEFHQAVKEVLESLRVVIEANEEKYRKEALLERLTEPEILRTVAFFRYINPKADIRLGAGRALLTNDGELAFKSGVSATITGNMLTTVACATIRSDRQLLKDMGRDVTPDYWKNQEN